MKPKLGQIIRQRPGWEIALSPIACVRLAIEEMRAARFGRTGAVDQFQRIELKSQSKSPVSQGVARSGKTQWHPYCSQTLINATNVEPRISWLPPSCTNREHAPFPAYSIRGQANPIQHKPLRRLILADIYDPCCYGGFQYVLLSSVGLRRSLWHSQSSLNLRYHWETRSLFLLLLGVAFFGGMLLSFRRIAHYNREVYPRLHWNWEHTYICRRCGKFRLIPS